MIRSNVNDRVHLAMHAPSVTAAHMGVAYLITVAQRTSLATCMTLESASSSASSAVSGPQVQPLVIKMYYEPRRYRSEPIRIEEYFLLCNLFIGSTMEIVVLKAS